MTRIESVRRSILEWVDNEQTGIVQAYRHMAEVNRSDAKALAEDNPAVSRICAESAQSWDAKADRLNALLDQIGEDEEL